MAVYSGRLEKFFTIEDLQAIEKAFNEDQTGGKSYRKLHRNEFCELMNRVFSHKWSRSEYTELFKNIDVRHEGYVDFGKFCSYMMHGFSKKHEKELRTSQIPRWKDPRITPNIHKDTIQRINPIYGSMARYITVSKEGTLGCWNYNGKLLKQGKIEMDYISAKNLWITCFCVIPNLNKIVIAFTSKEIAIYNFDISVAGDFSLLSRITDLPAIPLCMNTWTTNDLAHDTMLIYGDNTGMVTSIKFSAALLPSVEWRHWSEGKDEYIKVFKLPDVVKEYDHLKLQTIQAHKEWVREVRYIEKLESFLSCATTDTNSLVVIPVRHGTSTNMISFNILQGVNTFDYDDELNIIATGGVNHMVHLWNPYVNSKPVGVLRGHLASVIYTQFYSAKGQLISMGKNRVIRVWDAELHVCLQRLSGLFIKGPTVHCNLFFDADYRQIVAAISKELVFVEMKAELSDHVLTHTKPVSCVIYSSKWKEIITAGKDSTITMWLVETGQRERQFVNAHGEAEITCLALDSRQIQLFSGSVDGTVKIWDMNGHCHHTLVVADGKTVDINQILTLKRQIFVVGGNKYPCVFQFSDINVNSSRIYPNKWSAQEEHQDEIVSVAYHPPFKIATASFDGEIITWSLTTQKPTKKFKLRDKSASTTTSRDGGDTPIGSQISQILYLVKRESSLYTCDLVSCGGKGMVSFWNTSSMLPHPSVTFVAHNEVKTITMAVDERNDYLITGDSDGTLKIWDIQDYYKATTEIKRQMPPAMVASSQPHADGITALEICVYQNEFYILAASLDWTVSISNIRGVKIGVFGQAQNWKLETLKVEMEESEDKPSLNRDDSDAMSQDDEDQSLQPAGASSRSLKELRKQSNKLSHQSEDQDDGGIIFLPPIPNNDSIETKRKSKVSKDSQIGPLPSIGSAHKRSSLRSRESAKGRSSRMSAHSQYNEHFHPWDRTILGKTYQEHHQNKIKRRSKIMKSSTVPARLAPTSSLSNTSSYLYHSLDCSAELEEIPQIRLPDLKISTRTANSRYYSPGTRSPTLMPATKFTEKNLFPKYLLEFESKLKHIQKGQLHQVFSRRGRQH
ncbi:uncharacterized protein TRIADDRAFT_61879 [Trichoplax adhaerens]|uniref:WD repeat-containing protein on Y chromosome n=1 Tax=Trichoplax adhaerens TaxID=10228 RepID=B3SC47_TRIAD|nr:hypothetical protein TRIADDRAFT_61879 [Trichoplax adhaerens]EDV19696.1 hypothetical protein TRIADDRAFT_61879 [Trichoplax adhaerens]|eukprot:XP_002117853.1 hypothetical protein TRIADDRAFT_61879 [Trichoplax adhaerens]